MTAHIADARHTVTVPVMEHHAPRRRLAAVDRHRPAVRRVLKVKNKQWVGRVVNRVIVPPNPT